MIERKKQSVFAVTLSILFLIVSIQTAMSLGEREPVEPEEPEELEERAVEAKPVSLTGGPHLRDLAELTDAVLKAEDLMQKAQYGKANKVLEDGPIPEEKKEYAVWLRALALYRIPDFDSALQVCLENMEKRSENTWIHKVRFLAAEIYLQKKDFMSAERIYAEDARRLLSEGRKEDIAGVYIQFARTLSYMPKPEELDLPEPDYNRAYSFYKKALDLEIGPVLSEQVRFQMARMRYLSGQHERAVGEYRSYLQEFDPDWGKDVLGSRGGKIAFVGRNRAAARYHLAENLIGTRQYKEARKELEDLLTLLTKAEQALNEEIPKPELSSVAANRGEREKQAASGDMESTLLIHKWRRLSMRRIPHTYNFPTPISDSDLEAGLSKTEAFLEKYPDDSIAVTLAWHSVSALEHRGYADRSIQAARDFMSKKSFNIRVDESAEEVELRKSIGIQDAPAEQFDVLQKKALFLIGKLLFAQKDYRGAIQTYSEYTTKFPNGPDWTGAQRGIINAEFQIGADFLRNREYEQVRQTWDDFLIKHPLDPRSRQILFAMGQIEYQQGKDIKSKGKFEEAKDWFNRTIISFRKLVSKYPRTEESGLAQLRVGEILEKELGDLKGALEAYRKLNWSSVRYTAEARAAAMTRKELVVKTERIYRTDEPALVTLQLRNVESLKLKAYNLDLRAYFHKFHGIRGVEKLDLPLIAPDKTWEVSIAGYRDFLPIEQTIEIPMSGPGVYAVIVAGEELEATTLIIRSDIDIIIKSSRTELLVFVQNMLTNEPVSEASVLATDGTKVLFEEKTGKDGVLHKRHEALKTANKLSVFVSRDGNIASNALSLQGLSVSQGLAPKGYLYTDRPVYQPGQSVNLRGIVREVIRGTYAVPEENTLSCTIVDARGRTIFEKEITLSKYGTFEEKIELSSAAAQGCYSIRLIKDEPKRVFTGSFLVEEFKLEKIKLTLDFDKPVYFRGEAIKATFSASYYYGSPVVGKEISYRLPDGRELSSRTNEKGIVEIGFDTTPYEAGTSLSFRGRLTAENVSVRGEAFLAEHGFHATISLPRPVSLAGEPIEITVRTKDATDEPVARSLELTVLRREREDPDPLLEGIPWIDGGASAVWAEKTVKSFTLETSQEGIARVTFTPESGGQFVYRARGKDRFGNIVTAQEFSEVSGKDDKIKLRVFAERQHYKVGETASLRLHSRLEKSGLALITFEGEGVIGYRIREIEYGDNPIQFSVDHPHFPNFSFSAALMQSNRVEAVSLPFTVERELKIAIKSEKAYYAPGEKARVTIEVRDHLGKPVEAEFSLALVHEAIFANYTDPAGDIVAFFQEGIWRQAEMRMETSCTFNYLPETVLVDRGIADEIARLDKLSMELSGFSSREEAPMPAEAEEMAEDDFDYKRKEKPMASPKTEAISDREEQPAVEKKQEIEARRRETGIEGFWHVSVVTDATGRGTVTVPLPENITAYRITVKGCTVSTLVGEAAVSLAVRKAFFADLKVPILLQEKDAVHLVCNIHNLSDYQGPVKAALTLTSGDKSYVLQVATSISAGETTQMLFPSYTVPRGESLSIALDVAAGDALRDGLALSVPIRPWGLPFTDQKAGAANTDRTIHLELPSGKNIENPHLTITVGASVNQTLVDLVLQDWIEPVFDDMDLVTLYFPSQEPSELLALASLISYLEGKNAALQDLMKAQRRARAIVSQLTATQLDNGSWRYGSGSSEIEVTALSHWALAVADEQGIGVDAEALKRSAEFLRNRYASVAQDDYGLRAMILHALSVRGGVDYAFVNRLYRKRNALSEAALAYTALCLKALDRREMGLEVLALLDQKGVLSDHEWDMRRWSGERNLAWERSSVETTALVLLAFEALDPRAKQIEEGVNFLMSSRGSFGFRPVKAKGVVVAALTGYYKTVKEGLNDYTLSIAVNEQFEKKLEVKGGMGQTTIHVPRALIKSGENKVSFRLEGIGEYVYTAKLSGFSQDLRHEPSWEKPEIESKEYIHENLTYKGRTIEASTMAISELESGRLALVRIQLNGWAGDRYLVLEDTIPAGSTVLKDSIRGKYSFVQIKGGKVLFYFEPDTYLYSLSYQIAGYTPGEYRILPPVLRDAFDPGQMVLGKAATLTLLAPGEPSSEPYKMNRGELFGLGKAHFDDGHKPEAIELLEKLYARDKQYKRREVAQMLFWLRSEPEFYEANRLVEYFEILKENYPDLYIPFDKILTIGQAYHDMREYERAYLVYRATVEASFLKDAPIGGALEDAGELLGSIDFMTRLWREYPDSALVVETYFALAQELYNKAPQAESMMSRLSRLRQEKLLKVTQLDLINRSEYMLWRFMSVYSRNPLADDAAFSRVNLNLDRKAYAMTVSLCKEYHERFPESDFSSSFQYMEALGFFSMLRFNEAIVAARVVAERESEDRDLALYILGQVYHAQQNPAMAVSYYNQVKDKFSDAKEAANYFERKVISLDEVSTFRPGEETELKLKFRNIKEAHFQIYRVDLMKLYLKEKNLSRITSINLSGISPELESQVYLGDGKDYRDMEKTIPLDLKDEGAYLVICRGDDFFTSGLVLITPLEIDIHEDAVSGRLRVNVTDSEKGRYADNVHVKVIGSENEDFSSGETDLRGIFTAEGIWGTPTVIARDRENRYAFYRGRTWLGSPETSVKAKPERYREPEADYRGNTLRIQQSLQELNRQNLNRLYEEETEGVQVQEAY